MERVIIKSVSLPHNVEISACFLLTSNMFLIRPSVEQYMWDHKSCKYIRPQYCMRQVQCEYFQQAATGVYSSTLCDAGFFPPTSGTAIVNGFDIRHDIDSVRSSLGLCPQHNVLFDDLTVKEHLVFFTKVLLVLFCATVSCCNVFIQSTAYLMLFITLILCTVKRFLPVSSLQSSISVTMVPSDMTVISVTNK